MPLLLRHEEVIGCCSMPDAIDAVETGLKDQAAGALMQPQRQNLRFGEGGKEGFLRIGPCALLNAGWMGFKAMNLVRGVGVRYQIHLYEMASGELKAIMDAKHITTLRTGATSAIATRYLTNAEATSVGVIGSGNESWAQACAMAAIGKIKSLKVFSPTEANRIAYAERCNNELQVDAQPAATPDAAIDGAKLIIAAVNSSKNVLFGRQLNPGVHVNSVGTARPILREIDEDVFAKADIVVVDTREGVFEEAGDALAAVAAGTINPDDAFETHQLVSGDVPKPTSDDQITLFKSVGTALQDMSTAVRVYQNAAASGIGQKLDDFPYLLEKKPTKGYV